MVELKVIEYSAFAISENHKNLLWVQLPKAQDLKTGRLQFDLTSIQ